MEKQISIPNLNGLRVKHLPAIHHLQNFDSENKLEFMCGFVAKLSNRPLGFIMNKCDAMDIAKVYVKGVDVLSEFNNKFVKDYRKEPTKEIEIKGKVYELIDLKRPNVSFVIDADMSDFEKDPVRLACMCYVPKGTVYGQMDEAENVTNPIKDRYQDFADEFPLDEYLRLHAFFLTRYVKSVSLYIAAIKIQSQLKKAQSMIGLQALMLWLKKTTSNGARYFSSIFTRS
jgi:hypothetical protein